MRSKVAITVLVAALVAIVGVGISRRRHLERESAREPVAEAIPVPAPPVSPPPPLPVDGPAAVAQVPEKPAPVANTDDDRKRVVAVQKAFQRLSPAESSLYADFERNGASAPPEAAALLERYRAGAGRAELESFVRQSFPPSAAVRLAAMSWIARVRPQPEPPGEAPRAKRIGRLQPQTPAP
jgi:hypothetical protein